MHEGDRGSYLEITRRTRRCASCVADGIAAQLRGARKEAAAAAAPYTGSDADWDVWTRYDAVAGDDKEQYVELYNRLEGRNWVKKISIGKTHLGRDIWAVKVTQNAKTIADESRPAVLYNAQQHAREWLAGETCKRTLKYFADNYGTDTEAGEIVTPLVDTRELWFVCISNPDGYEYTFTEGNRLWRKNMADNNGDGVRGEPGDGVDPNRNFPDELGPRQRGLLGRSVRRDLPRHRAGLRARDEGDAAALEPRRLRVPEERPHRGRAAALSARLPAVHVDAGQRHLRGARR